MTAALHLTVATDPKLTSFWALGGYAVGHAPGGA